MLVGVVIEIVETLGVIEFEIDICNHSCVIVSSLAQQQQQLLNHQAVVEVVVAYATNVKMVGGNATLIGLDRGRLLIVR